MTQAITYAPRIPLHSLGYGRRDLSGFHTHRVRAPRYPLHSLGYIGDGAQAGAVISKAGAPIAGSITTSLATSAGWGAWAGPVGAAVAVGIGLVAGLLAAHALRAKQAKNENSAVNIGIQGFDADLKQIQQAFNSGQVDLNTAIQAAQIALSNYWQLVTPHIQPGRNGCAGGSGCPGQNVPVNYCQGSIGAACCVGCGSISRSVNGPDGVIAALQGRSTHPSGPNTARIYQVYSSKYGTNSRSGYTLTFTAPAAGTAAGVLQSFTGGGPGSSGSIMPLLLIGGVALLFLR